MKYLFALSAVLAFVAAPALAGGDKNKDSTEQSATEEKDSGVVEKAVKLKAIDKVGKDGVVEKGAKAKVLRK
jgi:hypothetical protein